MIDLHMHTTYSDGNYSVLDLIKILNENNIKYASITDHNSVDAHVEFEENGYSSLFNGNMIRGVEIQTVVDGYLIEVLVYNYDLNKFKKFVDEAKVKFWNFHEQAYRSLLKKADAMGLKYIEPNRELGGSYYSNTKFQEAIAACLEENKKIVPEKILTDKLYFYRCEFQNPNSQFYIDSKQAFPSLEQVIENAHNSNGLVVLAHIDEYKTIENKDKFLERVFTNYNLDGLECFHPSINIENREKYLAFAKSHNLLISAGSDFHGPNFSHRMNINTEANFSDVSLLSKVKDNDLDDTITR